MTGVDPRARASEPLEIRIAQALRVRTRIPMAAKADAAQPLIRAASWQVTLEQIGLDGLYRVLLIAVKDDEVRMLTNFTLRPHGMPYLDAPGDVLVASQATSQQLADSIAARLSRTQFEDGPGGPESAADAGVHFLTIRSTTETKKTALYFYHYPATSTRYTRPDGADGPRWDAINGVFELWRELVTNPAFRPS